MDLELETLVRKRFYVGAIKVTDENMQVVANWCGGRINNTPQDSEKGQRRYIRMPIPRNRNVRGRAFAGDYILQLGDSFRAYTESSVWEFFERLEKKIEPGKIMGIEDWYKTSALPTPTRPTEKEHSELRVAPSHPSMIPHRVFGDVVYDENTDSLVVPGASVSIPAKEAAKQILKLVKEEEARIEFEKLVKTLLASGPGSFERYILVYYVDGIETTDALPEGHDCFKNSCAVVTEPNFNFFDYRTIYKIFHKHKTEITEEIDPTNGVWHLDGSGEGHLSDYCYYIGCGGV